MVPSILVFGGAFLPLPGVLAGYQSSQVDNIAIYWGQNSVSQKSSQTRLRDYCVDSEPNIIPLAFLDVIKTTTVNFANAGDNCTLFPSSTLLKCEQMEEDIQTCQDAGKTILLSIGGATYSEGGFASSEEAVNSANTVWAMFGPSTSDINRPFGKAVIDGFDFDLESRTTNMIPFAQQLRSLMDAAGGKTYYLSAAPQCFYPDASVGDLLSSVPFDFAMIQFYNNWCGVNSFVPGENVQTSFNFDVWDGWARTISANKKIKNLLGVPGNVGGGGGYVDAGTLAEIISYSKQYPSFGGLMMWDMSQVYGNSGFLSAATLALVASSNTSDSSPPPPLPLSQPSSLSWTTVMSTATVSPSMPTTPAAGVPQWAQCGGEGYTGSTVCAAPYTCIYGSEWWSVCR